MYILSETLLLDSGPDIETNRIFLLKNNRIMEDFTTDLAKFRRKPVSAILIALLGILLYL
jgi:hypothetical protein